MHAKRFNTFFKILVQFRVGAIPRLPSFPYKSRNIPIHWRTANLLGVENTIENFKYLRVGPAYIYYNKLILTFF